MRFNLFDTVRLKKSFDLGDGVRVPAGTLGSIVEVLNKGEAYLVECFGSWVKYDVEENFVPASREDPEAFIETLGIELLFPPQIELLKPADEAV